jgi:hypothetical protein
MFSFYLNRRVLRRGVFAMLVMFCLSAALFTSCENGTTTETGFIPVGVWSSEWDGYNITITSVKYGDLEGSIEKAVDFSNDAGVLIIKITVTDGNFTVGKYTGVYYSAYTPTGIKLANVWLSDDENNWYVLEANSLSEAESLFNAANVSAHVSYWGNYLKE